MYLRVYVESCAANDYLTIALFAIYDNWNIFERDEVITSPSIKVNVGMRTCPEREFHVTNVQHICFKFGYCQYSGVCHGEV